MSLVSLKLKNFRNHKNANFLFPETTIIIGKNTVGKTSILEAIHFLSLGKSFKADKDIDIISTGKDFARIEGTIQEGFKTELTGILALKDQRFVKKYLVNNVARRQIDFTTHFSSVLFTPEDLEIITDSPSLRRNYVNNVLSKVDRKYKIALSIYEKALRQRNRMLYLLREGKKYFSDSDFEYWDNILIENGEILTNKREEFVNYINTSRKEIFNYKIFYDKSTITFERLLKYRDAERTSATTLVGPNRDDFLFLFPEKTSVIARNEEVPAQAGKQSSQKPISEFGSRGEQRLTIFQTKILETFYIKEETEQTPTLLLDDIFSELDNINIHKVLNLLPNQQTILTTTHKEFIPEKILKNQEVEITELS